MIASLPIEMSYPFSLNNSGGITFTSDPVKIAEDHIVSVLGTRFGERVMRPTYGSSVQNALYGFADIDDDNLIVNAVNEALNTWEPGVQIIDVTIDRKTNDAPNSTISINVNFRIIGTKNAADYSPVYTATVKVGGTVIDQRT